MVLSVRYRVSRRSAVAMRGRGRRCEKRAEDSGGGRHRGLYGWVREHEGGHPDSDVDGHADHHANSDGTHAHADDNPHCADQDGDHNGNGDSYGHVAGTCLVRGRTLQCLGRWVNRASWVVESCDRRGVLLNACLHPELS